MKICILSSIIALTCMTAFAKDTGRKIASVDLGSEKAVKQKALDVSKAYIGKPTNGKITSWNVTEVKKVGKNIIVSLTYIHEFSKEEQGECYLSVTLTPGDENDGKRMNGTALVEAGMCAS